MTESNALVQATATAKPERLTIAEEIKALKAANADLEVRIGQQDAHITALHRVIDQFIDHVNEELGTDWRPDLLALPPSEEVPEMVVTNDRSARARRADRFKGEGS